jgi:uncharacterized protein (TIGR00369 family)
MNKYRQLIEAAFPNIRHCMVLGMTVEDADFGRLILRMPYLETMVGDPQGGVIHGGALTTLMDSACGFAAMLGVDGEAVCPTLDLRIDYMRPATPGLTVYADAEVYRVTESVIFTRAIAHHGDTDLTIAAGVGNFFRMEPDLFADMRRGFRASQAVKNGKLKSGDSANG